MNCKICGTKIQGNTGFCPCCGEKADLISDNKLGMKFYIFQTYFLMPLSVLLDVIIGVLMISNTMYKFIGSLFGDIIGSSVAVLQSEMKWINIAYGVFLIAMAFYHGYISLALLNFKAVAIRNLYIVTVLNEVMGLVYFIASVILVRGFIQFDAEFVSKLISNAVSSAISITLWLLIYSKYYNKRKHLFVN